MGLGIGGNYSSSDASANSNFLQSIPKWQVDQFKKIYGMSNDLYNSVQGMLSGQMPNVQNYVDNVNSSAMPEWQSQLQGGVYSGMDNANKLSESLQNSLNNPTATSQIYAQMMGGQGNNYADAMKASYAGDANRATDNMLSNLDARATAAGMSGGSRHGIATAQGMYDINSNLQKNLAKTGYDTFNQDLNNKLGIASQADSNTLARQQMMQNMLNSQQGVSTGALNSGSNMQNLGMGSFAPTMMPWTNMSNLSNTVGGPTVLNSGNSNSNSSSMGIGAGGSK